MGGGGAGGGGGGGLPGSSRGGGGVLGGRGVRRGNVAGLGKEIDESTGGDLIFPSSWSGWPVGSTC